MAETAPQLPLLVGLVGILIVLAILMKSLLRRIGVPEVAGYLFVGILFAFLDFEFGFLTPQAVEVLAFLGNLGIIALLFRVGVESDTRALLHQLRKASAIWVGNVAFSAGTAFLAARWVLGMALIPSLFAAGVLTASSVGASISVWRQEGQMGTLDFDLFLDVAELDELAGVIVMGVLLSVAPTLHAGEDVSVAPLVVKSALWFLFKLFVIVGACFLFARFMQRPLLDFFDRLELPPDRLLSVVGVAMLIAAAAGALGFTVGIGAFFAGLTFSQVRDLVTEEASFDSLYDFLTPFFLITIGLRVSPDSLGLMVGMGGVMLVAAVVGKLVGGAVGWRFAGSRRTTSTLALSLIPRAEIAMVVLDAGHRLGEWAMPDAFFSAMVFVSFATCLVGPLALRWHFRRHPTSG